MEDLREVQFSVSEAAFVTALSQAEVQKAVDEGWFASARRRVTKGLTRRSFYPADLVHLRLIKDVCDWAVLHTDTKRMIHRQLCERLPGTVFARGNRIVIVEAKDDPRSNNEALVEQLNRHLAQLDATSPPPAADSTLPRVETLTHWARSVAKRLKEPIRIAPATFEVGATWREIADRMTQIIAAQSAVVSDPEIRGGEPVVRGTRIPAHLLYDLNRQGASSEELLADYPALNERSLRSALLYARTHPRRGRPKKGPWHERRLDE